MDVVVPIGVDDTPNFTGEVVSAAARNALPTRAWAEEQQRALTPGEYRARVLGEWPERSEYALIEPEWIDMAMAREAPKEDQNGKRWWCFDPGSGGDPSTQSWSVRGSSVYDGSELPRVTLQILSSDRDRKLAELLLVIAYGGIHGVDAITVDTFGVGADHAVAHCWRSGSASHPSTAETGRS